ncbi:MAG: hypothetical protein NT130_03500 [Candidatus Micrarchaeota archaeon]|nr:hypothetical protein [Candidatus Micrarchaeota archaeon]
MNKNVENRLILGNNKSNQLCLEYGRFETGDTIHIKFLQGATGQYFYKEEIEQLLDYLMNIYQSMK